MKLSILLMSYNQEEYINQCIESILFQNIPFRYEVIVADDCSTDNTLSIIKNKLFENNINFKILDTPVNLGISKNYERGFAACMGEYIAIMEGDDYWTKNNRLINHLNFLDLHQECVLTINRYSVFNVNSNQYFHIGWYSSEDFKYITTQDMAKGNKLGNLSACVFRKTETDKINPDLYNLEIADWILGLVMSQNGYIAILKEIMSVYRVHEKGVWSKMSNKKRELSLITFIDTYNHYLGYKYNKEFVSYKLKLLSGEVSNKSNFKYYDSITRVLLIVIKILIPKKILKAIKSKIRND